MALILEAVPAVLGVTMAVRCAALRLILLTATQQGLNLQNFVK